MKHALILLALTFSGCVEAMPPTWDRPGFTATIDPAFSVEEMSTVLRVLNEWFKAIPEARLGVEISTPANIVRANDDAPLTGIALILGQANRSGIKLWANEAGPLFEGVVRHEVAHFLGGHHTDTGESLIPYSWKNVESWTCINAADIASVCEGRGGCDGPTFPNCPE